MKPGIIDITNRKELNSLLSQLKPDTPALWGRLTAKPMIEHLIEAVEYTNGKKTAIMVLLPEEANKIKQTLVYGDFVITPGAKGYLSDATKQNRFTNLQTAIDELNKEMDAFELFFKAEKRTSVHPEFGPLDHKEWIIWHGKHFTHHFKQFGLISDGKWQVGIADTH
ncbi:MAG TPA: hypothetical protein VFP87_02445 [Chitinophagaceae bacterium]|nr:hypothetical protein [Chitinophagaceae bacterium]